MNILKKTAEIITYLVIVALTGAFWWMCTINNLRPVNNGTATFVRQTVKGHDGRNWKYAEAGAVQATAQDIIKFARTKTRLLVQLAWNQTPAEAQIFGQLNDGTVAKVGPPMNDACRVVFGEQANWVYTSQIMIVACLPDPPKIACTVDVAVGNAEKAKAAAVKEEEATKTEAQKWAQEIDNDGQWFDFGDGRLRMTHQTRIKLQELAQDLAAEAKGLDLFLSSMTVRTNEHEHDNVCGYMLRIKRADHDLQVGVVRTPRNMRGWEDMNEYDEKPIWTAIQELSKRLDVFKHDMGTVVLSLKGLLELSLSLRDSEREMLDVLKSLASQDQKQLDIINDLAGRVEQNERAANMSMSPEVWRKQMNIPEGDA